MHTHSGLRIYNIDEQRVFIGIKKKQYFCFKFCCAVKA